MLTKPNTHMPVGMRVREAVLGIVLFEIVGFSRALLDSSMSSKALPDILTDDRWWAYLLSRLMTMSVVLVRHMRMRVPKRQVPMSMTVGSDRHCIVKMFVMPVIMSVGVLVCHRYDFSRRCMISPQAL